MIFHDWSVPLQGEPIVNFLWRIPQTCERYEHPQRSDKELTHSINYSWWHQCWLWLRQCTHQMEWKEDIKWQEYLLIHN